MSNSNDGGQGCQLFLKDNVLLMYFCTQVCVIILHFSLKLEPIQKSQSEKYITFTTLKVRIFGFTYNSQRDNFGKRVANTFL